MQNQFELKAIPRSERGKNAMRRLRRSGRVPVVVYGGGGELAHLSVEADELFHHLSHEAFYSHVLSLNVEGRKENVILRDLQRHPSKPRILHLDLLYIREDQEIKVHVPLHFLGEEECVGVKEEGGVINHLQTDVEVSCLPGNLPEFIEVDITQLQLGHSLHLSDIKVPEGVTIVALTHGDESDSAIVSVFRPRVVEEETPVDEAAAEGEEAAAEGAQAAEPEDRKQDESDKSAK